MKYTMVAWWITGWLALSATAFCIPADTAGLQVLDTSHVNDVLHNRYLLPVATHQRAFTFRENDTTVYPLYLATNKAGQPLYYFSNIFTPVCYTGECKPVYINFYWDLLGNYIRYDLPVNEALTKLDHKVFKPADYEKMQDILAKSNSLLASLKITDLIVPGTENLTDSVDARTGATLKTIKNEVISGAVYSCYTLWHIAHGPVVEEMMRITETYSNEAMWHRMLASGNYAYQYWAIDKVMDKSGHIKAGFEPDIREVVAGKNVFLTRYLIQQLHPDFMSGKSSQRWLWKIYAAAAYPVQVTILRKLKNIPLDTALTRQLADVFPNANTEQSALILPLLQQAPVLPLEQLAAQLTSADAEKAAIIYTLIQQRKPDSKHVKKQLYNYEKRISQ
ncbi:MAG: hypothetical protein J7623_01705 [Chitinophaga sp.]|uniref:hypothetical protein n=1 Tax=Chitinophaga sp. TaxID=1869181 RepID=UPI001B01360D|nr:hypothetical protein [Chitinophaga sp.]MBO9727331.1 hypothetical protein [Chitinophaga sp.]